MAIFDKNNMRQMMENTKDAIENTKDAIQSTVTGSNKKNLEEIAKEYLPPNTIQEIKKEFSQPNQQPNQQSKNK